MHVEFHENLVVVPRVLEHEYALIRLLKASSQELEPASIVIEIACAFDEKRLLHLIVQLFDVIVIAEDLEIVDICQDDDMRILVNVDVAV